MVSLSDEEQEWDPEQEKADGSIPGRKSSLKKFSQHWYGL
jgi:hypothetical protein